MNAFESPAISTHHHSNNHLNCNLAQSSALLSPPAMYEDGLYSGGHASNEPSFYSELINPFACLNEMDAHLEITGVPCKTVDNVQPYYYSTPSPSSCSSTYSSNLNQSTVASHSMTPVTAEDPVLLYQFNDYQCTANGNTNSSNYSLINSTSSVYNHNCLKSNYNSENVQSPPNAAQTIMNNSNGLLPLNQTANIQSVQPAPVCTANSVSTYASYLEANYSYVNSCAPNGQSNSVIDTITVPLANQQSNQIINPVNHLSALDANDCNAGVLGVVIGYDEDGKPIRSTANKKERRRTLSINNAFSSLRDCIPNVPSDTKLSKIKTLRLATSYISYLMELLDDSPCSLNVNGKRNRLTMTCEDFKVDLQRFKGKSKTITLLTNIESCQTGSETGNKIKSEYRQIVNQSASTCGNLPSDPCTSLNGSFAGNTAFSMPSEVHPSKRVKGRTGWPQHVWASELQETATN